MYVNVLILIGPVCYRTEPSKTSNGGVLGITAITSEMWSAIQTPIFSDLRKNSFVNIPCLNFKKRESIFFYSIHNSKIVYPTFKQIYIYVFIKLILNIVYL